MARADTAYTFTGGQVEPSNTLVRLVQGLGCDKLKPIYGPKPWAILWQLAHGDNGALNDAVGILEAEQDRPAPHGLLPRLQEA